MKQCKLYLLMAAFAGIGLFACQKQTQYSRLQVRMTDAPIDMQEVNVDLQAVNLKFASDTSGWVSMKTNAGIYNLLGLQNGIDTLIGDGLYPTGELKEIRLVLGPNNTIKTGDEVYPLTIPSGATSGLKLKVNKALDNTVETLLIDFDAALSVKEETDGYKLRPVLKIK